MGCPIVHFEIGCRNSAKTVAFYRDLFGWKFEAYGPANMIDTGGGTGISGHISSLGHEPHNYVVTYAQVENLEASIQKANQLGGKTMVPPTEVPGMGHFAWITDPEGTIFGLWKPAQA
ncbi:MAG: VOC family protein [Phycisphaerae bacterium]|nr:VOC family protein [Phycisphaerae bacterium]